jgi:hypothetical protein
VGQRELCRDIIGRGGFNLMVRALWDARDRPLLMAIAEQEENGGPVERIELLFGLKELSDRDITAGIRALYKDGLIDGIDASSMQGFHLLEIELTGDGRRAIGQWPSGEPYAEFLTLIANRAAATGDPEERSRLEQLAAALKGLGEGVVANLLAALIQRQTGI